MLKLCKYGYGNFKKQKTVIPSHNMILNTTFQIFRLLLSRKYVCRLLPINCDFSTPAERVRLMTCRLIGNYHDREFTLYNVDDFWPSGSCLHCWLPCAMLHCQRENRSEEHVSENSHLKICFKKWKYAHLLLCLNTILNCIIPNHCWNCSKPKI